jgi:hypothetical protein
VVYWCNSYNIVHCSLDIIEWFKYKLKKVFKLYLILIHPPLSINSSSVFRMERHDPTIRLPEFWGEAAEDHLHTRRRTSTEFRLNDNIGDFNMGEIILHLGSEVNLLPKKTWKCMGDPKLAYSHVQLKLANQHRVLPIGRMKGVTIDLEDIEIVDDKTPYPSFLGLDWAFDNQAIINFKTRKMTFESIEYRVIAPLDPSKGERFVEPTCLDLEEIGQLYRTIVCEEDYVNPATDGVLS